MNKNVTLKVSILSIFFLNMAPTLVIPALHRLSAAFPEIPFSTIVLAQTLPCLLMIPVALISGALAGKKVKFRTMNIIGIILFIIGGITPFFLSNFTSILLSRVLFGIGIGIISPMGNALVLKFYHGQDRVNLVGIGNVFVMSGGIMMQLASGFLCAISWQYTFLVHLIAIIPLLLVILLLPEPDKEIENDHHKEKLRMPFAVYGYTLMFGIMVMLNYTMVLNISTIMAERSLGSPALAGLVLSLFTAGGMLAGLVFGNVYKLTAKYTIALGLLITAAGLGFADFAGNIIIFALGSLVTGIGFSTVMPAVIVEIGAIAPPASIGMATGMVIALMNGGMFFSPYYMALVQNISSQNNVWFPVCVSMILLVIGAFLLIFYQYKQTPSPERQNSSIS
ncbi:MFS transporter [Dehalobacter sp. DCM]|uniref:MFS transporter n=1 Tax=Dehalobacter sp. DCM TaxID=2907827 RepID=UPI00308170FF|nr:MFS transporter [Dehalobacter sp. DCM]